MLPITRVTSLAVSSSHEKRRITALMSGGVALLSFSLTGCWSGSDHADPTNAQSVHSHSPSKAPATPLVDLLRAFTSFDYQPSATPAALVKHCDIAVIAKVQRATKVEVANEGESTAGVVLTLEIERAWKPTDDGARTIDVFLRWPQNVGLDAFERDLPSGSRMVILGSRSDTPVLGRDGDAPLYAPAPEGFLVESGEGTLINVWGEGAEASEAWKAADTLDAMNRAIGSP